MPESRLPIKKNAFGCNGVSCSRRTRCEAVVGPKLYERANQELAGDVVYVGRGCPASELANDVSPVADHYVGDPSGRIALVDGVGPENIDEMGLSATVGDAGPGDEAGPGGVVPMFHENASSGLSGCTLGQKVQRAAAAGATAVVVSKGAHNAPVAPGGESPMFAVPVVGLEFKLPAPPPSAPSSPVTPTASTAICPPAPRARWRPAWSPA